MDNNGSGGTKESTGSVELVRQLNLCSFPDASSLPVVQLRGYELTSDYLIKNGFDRPILVHCKDGLDLRVPHDSFSVQDVEDHVGSLKEVDIIDVEQQEEGHMLMREWTEYFTSICRPRILNVVSLEFTGTKLADLVDPPRIVHDLSWVSNHWPTDIPPEDMQFVRPEVQRYCLMSTKDSYTDFHIDFGGTSVWYHILRGEKIFFLIPPTTRNLLLYERWLVSPNKLETLFAKLVDVCYRCEIKAGETVFLPSGWIHAVITPMDSLVFGGNFLHSLSIPLQLKIYEMEKRTHTPDRYLFPNFETLHWFVLKHMRETLTEHREDHTAVPAYLSNGARCLFETLRDWSSDLDLRNRIHRNVIPDTIRHRRLLQDMAKELQLLRKGGGRKRKPGRKRKRSESTSDDEVQRQTKATDST
jgi:hypothetical protein